MRRAWPRGKFACYVGGRFQRTTCTRVHVMWGKDFVLFRRQWTHAACHAALPRRQSLHILFDASSTAPSEQAARPFLLSRRTNIPARTRAGCG
jgi:hypothetical protein